MKPHSFLLALCVFLGMGQAAAQSTPPYVFAVNEGVTYRVNPLATAERFRDLGEDLAKVLKRPVKIVPVTDYRDLATGLAEQRYDLAWVHPAHHAIRAMSRSGYRLVALTKGFTEYRASFLVPGNSPLKTLAELRGGKIGAPDEDSITSVIMRATMREAGGEMPPVSYVKMQDAVPFMVEHGLVMAGVTASKSVVKDWQDKGGKVLFASKPVPIKQLLAGPRLSDAQREQVTAYFVALDQSATGKQRLESLNVGGFIEFDQAALTGIGKWLGI